MKCLIRTSLVAALCAISTVVGAQQFTEVGRPRIAVAPNGNVAIAQEVFDGEWKVAVQIYSPSGSPIGPLNVFEGESCGSLDIWTSDFVDEVDLEFRTDGILLVLMRHAGDLSFGGDQLVSAEATLGAIATDGTLIDLSDSPCVGFKLVFVNGGRQDRPRMALTGNNEVFVALDGFIQGANLRNVGIRVLNADLAEVIEQVIPHADELSQQAFHMFPDVVVKGALIGTTWHQCPIVDQQGNANECDIGAQFIRIENGQLVAAGSNQLVSQGDPPGTYSIWPSMAMNNADRSVIVWADTRTGFAGEIFGQLFNGENKVGSNFQISTGDGAIMRRPEVAMKSDGGFMVVWEDSSSAGFSARGREYAANGQPVSNPFELKTGANTQSGAPHVAVNGNGFLYTWVGASGGALGVFSNLFTPTAGEDIDVPELPQDEDSFELTAYPNPFADKLTVDFTLSEPAEVVVDVYDLLGRHVAMLENAVLARGRHSTRVPTDDLPGGMYVLRLSAGVDVATKVIVSAR